MTGIFSGAILFCMTAKQPAPAKATKKKTAVQPKPKGKPVAKTAISRKKQIPAPVERMEKGKKATKSQHDKIVEEVGKLISELHTRRHIIQHISKRWGITTSRQVDNYISKATELFANEMPDPQRAAADLLEKLLIAETLYRGADPKAHVAVLNQIRQMLVPKKVQFGGDPEGAPIKTEQHGIVISPEQIQEALDAFEQQNKKS